MTTAAKRKYIRVRVAATKNRQTREKMATIDLTRRDAWWLFVHAAHGANTWLSANYGEGAANRSFYAERLGAYRRLIAECEHEPAEGTECVIDFTL